MKESKTLRKSFKYKSPYQWVKIGEPVRVQKSLVENSRAKHHTPNPNVLPHSLSKFGVQSNNRNIKNSFDNFYEHYCIIIKPKLTKSRSCSDLTTEPNEFLLKYGNLEEGACGDSTTLGTTDARVAPDSITTVSMSFSRNMKSKKSKKKNDDFDLSAYATSFAKDYIEQSESRPFEASTSDYVENPHVDGAEHCRKISFPFKQTPSGNFKVQSNQVVFQSPTVGVLLADPTNAKVKVKFEGSSFPTDLKQGGEEMLSGREPAEARACVRSAASPARDDRSHELASLGYSMGEPVDWSRVQLPKKADLYQEFYRRVHNYINTDIVVKIEEDEFQCHLLVLRVYSTYFDKICDRTLELPADHVSPQAFQTIYEWMVLCGSDSHKTLRRDNIIDLFCAAQYLQVKDLEEQCWSFIVNEELFTEDTAFSLFQEARQKKITPIMELMVPRVMRFFLPLVASCDFLKLSLDEVLVFLSSNYICVTSEMEVLMAGVRWLRGEWPARQRHVVEVMRCVRFGLVSPWQLVDIKRNRDNPELLEMVQEPEVQHMVDDGLAYVIIKYWYGNGSKNYYHWTEALGLAEPAERNWIGEEKNHPTYKEFLKYLEQFLVPREQAYQLLAMQLTPRRNEDLPGCMRGVDADKLDMRRQKMDFPLPATLKGLTDNKGFPTMSDFLDSRRKGQDSFIAAHAAGPSAVLTTSPPEQQSEPRRQYLPPNAAHRHPNTQSAHHGVRDEQEELVRQIEQQKQHLRLLQRQHIQLQQSSLTDTQGSDVISVRRSTPLYQPAEREGLRETNQMSNESDGSSDTTMAATSDVGEENNYRRRSVAATYLATATAALSSPSRVAPCARPPTAAASAAAAAEAGRRVDGNSAEAAVAAPPGGRASGSRDRRADAEQISIYNESKDALAKANINKLSQSILGPPNKNYLAEGSLFNWERETVLVFGGVDPHTPYGQGSNTGRDIHRFDPVTNVWEYVGDLPVPRHHHAIAFLRGRIYLVGGADPRDDEVHGKSVVVSTVWSYDPVTRAWYNEAGLAVPRKNFGLVAHRMALYAIGGQDKKGRVLRSVERLEARAGAWSEVRGLGVPRMGVACAKYRDYIWVAGGMTGDRRRPLSRVVECYNSTTDEWTEINCLRFPRCFSTLFSMNDKLFIVGGAARLCEKEKSTSSVGAVDVWDWQKREWKPLTEMSIPRHGHALAYLGTQIVIIGGVTTIYMRALNNVESYCCERSSWIRGVGALPSPLSGHGAVTLPPASLM